MGAIWGSVGFAVLCATAPPLSRQIAAIAALNRTNMGLSCTRAPGRHPMLLTTSLGWIVSEKVPGNLFHRALLHRQLRFEIFQIAEDRGDGEDATVLLVFQQAIFRFDVAINRDLVPLLGVPDVVDRHIVVLAPEERHRVESF